MYLKWEEMTAAAQVDLWQSTHVQEEISSDPFLRCFCLSQLKPTHPEAMEFAAWQADTVEPHCLSASSLWLARP